MIKLVKHAWKEGLGESTRKKYGQHLDLLIEFVLNFQLLDKDGYVYIAVFTEECVMYFCGWLKQTKKQQPDSIRGTLCGIVSEFSSMGLPNPLHCTAGTMYPGLHRMLRGLKRAFGKPRRRRKGLTTDKLRKVVIHLQTRTDLSQWDKDTIECCLILGVYLLLRIGEMVTKKVRVHNEQKNACFGDIEFLPSKKRANFVQFHLRSSKTDPFREGCTLRAAANGTRTCPVAAAKRMVRHRSGDNAAEALFKMSDGSFLTRERLQRHMRTSLAAVGLVPGYYASHSLRIGGATSLAACKDFGTDRIRVLGRWASDCFLRYLRETNLMLVQASRAMAAVGESEWTDLDEVQFNPDAE